MRAWHPTGRTIHGRSKPEVGAPSIVLSPYEYSTDRPCCSRLLCYFIFILFFNVFFFILKTPLSSHPRRSRFLIYVRELRRPIRVTWASISFVLEVPLTMEKKKNRGEICTLIGSITKRIGTVDENDIVDSKNEMCWTASLDAKPGALYEVY